MNEQNQPKSAENSVNEVERSGAPRRQQDRPRRPQFGGRRPQGHGPQGQGGHYRGGRDPRGRYEREEQGPDPRLLELIQEAEQKLSDTHVPLQLENLSPFERKQVHQHFERKKTTFETKTYRDGENYSLWIFPVANLRKFAEDKAKEALENGQDVALPPMSKYERFIVHNILKEMDSIETVSVGEENDRHIEIHPKRFGRSLRRIVKKIKLF